jgi:peptidyl-tRNA hydrolase, PTH1 family
MVLLVGLGNPGEKYRHHRHNIGFRAVEHMARLHNFGPWKKKFQGELCEGVIAGEKILLLKPQTYMNESGRSVGEAMRFHKIALADVIVFYDELDLAPGKLRMKLGGGAAGHNGIRSIDDHVGADFRRVRLGIGHPGEKSRLQTMCSAILPRRMLFGLSHCLNLSRKPCIGWWAGTMRVLPQPWRRPCMMI